MGLFETIGGVGTTPFTSPLFQKKTATYETTEEEHSKQNPYWYKNNGKKITKYIYCKLQSKINPDTGQGGHGLQTNDPDPCGIKAKHKKDREKKKK